MISRLIAAITLLLAITGCATSTAPGAVGVKRSQLMMVPSSSINAQAATLFSKVTSEAASEGKLNTDVVMTTRVREIATRLIAQVGAFRPEAVRWNWEVNVIDSEKLNAFCMPGGKIVVFSGLITRLDLNDAELAAVMGHEIAHALREHSREKASQQALSNAAVQAIASTNYRYAGVHASLAQIGSLLFLHLPFSREMELESDVIGLELMARAGYDPKMASNVWRKMQMTQGGGRSVEFFATHPNSANRIVALENAVPKVDHLYAQAVASRTLRLAETTDSSSRQTTAESGATSTPVAGSAAALASESGSTSARLSALVSSASDPQDWSEFGALQSVEIRASDPIPTVTAQPRQDEGSWCHWHSRTKETSACDFPSWKECNAAKTSSSLLCVQQVTQRAAGDGSKKESAAMPVASQPGVSAAAKGPSGSVNPADGIGSIQKRLQQLNELRKQGLITEAEYNDKRKEILSKL